MRNPVLLLAILIAYTTACHAQSGEIGTMIQRLKSAKQDSAKVMLLHSISRAYWNKNPDSAILMGQQTVDLARSLHFGKGIAFGLLSIGVAQVNKGDYSEGLKNQLQALRISDSLGLEDVKGRIYDDLGILYMNSGDYARARGYLHESLRIAQKLNSKTAIESLLVNLGEVYRKNYEYDSAIAYNLQAVALARELKDTLSIAISLFNIGDNYVRKEQPDTALPYLKESLSLSQKVNDYEGIAYCYNALAQAYRLNERIDQSITYARIGLHLAGSLGYSEVEKESCNILYQNYQQLKDFEKALQFRNQELQIQDSLYTITKDKELRNLQSSYELEKEQHQVDLLNEDRALQREEVGRERSVRNILLSGFVVLGLLTFFLYRSNTMKKTLNDLLKMQNEGMVTQNKLLEDLNALKNRILSIIGHDLRGPIGALRNVVDMMKEESLTEEEYRQLWARMEESLLGTEHLLENLLFWAKSQMDGMQVYGKEFPVQELVLRNIRLLENRAKDKGVELWMEETVGPVEIYADETMTDIVIRNLLENAIKFSKAGGKVVVKAEARTGSACITVSDNGQGISWADQPRIFDKSASFTTTGTQQEKGSGLGLTLCRELVENNGGSIGFDSLPGKGSSFWFVLPSHQKLVPFADKNPRLQNH